jgi:hypothetical protein
VQKFILYGHRAKDSLVVGYTVVLRHQRMLIFCGKRATVAAPIFDCARPVRGMPPRDRGEADPAGSGKTKDKNEQKG